MIGRSMLQPHKVAREFHVFGRRIRYVDTGLPAAKVQRQRKRDNLEKVVLRGVDCAGMLYPV